MDDPIGERSLDVMSQSKWYNELIFNRFIRPNLGQKTLEIGSGIGNYTKMLVRHSDFVLATDIRKRYLTILKKIKNKKIKVAYGDIEKNIFKPGFNKFNSLVCLNVLEHIKDDKSALINMRKRLITGGKLILLVPAHNQFFGTLDENLGHYRRYNKDSLRKKLTKSGFKILSENYFNPISGLGWFVNSRILRKNVINQNTINIFNLVVKPIINFEKYLNVPFGLSVIMICQK